MKIPVLEMGDWEKGDFTFLRKGTNGVALLLRYNIDELLELVEKEKGK